MIAKKSSTSVKKRGPRRAWPYILCFILVMATVVLGSINKNTDYAANASSMESIASNNYNVSADQLSEFYIVSELASSMQLPTAEAVNVNYNSLSVLRDISQTTTDKIEKPDIVDTSNLAHGGFATHVVADGESLDSIAAEYGVTVTQIRWSNGLSSTDVSAGTELRIPVAPGILYTVKEGDTVASVAAKYNSTVDAIIAYNELNSTNELTPGAVILLPSGELPEDERPEHTNTTYVTPTTVTTSSYNTNHTYWTSSNPMPYGWCTYYAWGRRNDMGGAWTLPGGLGNANMWAAALSGSYRIDRTPEPGAVFQNYSGYYGHVGIVDSVNADGTITISDMNGIAGWGRVGTATIPQSVWGTYTYIHERY